MNNKLKKFEIIQNFNLQDKIIIEDRLISKNTFYPTHFHDYLEVEIFLEGKCEHIYNGTKYDVGERYAHILSYYDFHSIYAVSDMRLINIRFHEDFITSKLANYLLTPDMKHIIHFDEQNFERIKNIITQLEKEQLSNNLFKDIAVVNLFEQLLIYMLRESDSGNFTGTPQLIQQAVASIHKRFKKPLTLKQLADIHSVSPNHLGLLFKKNLGMSFNDYLNQIRLKYACRLLLSTDTPVKEIAFSSGYSSVEYFFYAFKKKINMTPLEFRQIHSDENVNIVISSYSTLEDSSR